MPSFHLTLLRETAQPDQTIDAMALFGALWLQHGKVSVSGAPSDQGPGMFLQGRTRIRAVADTAVWLRFALTRTPMDSPEILFAQEVPIEGGPALFRLDTVTFPPGACAWRHVHPGPGIRHLLQGELCLTSDNGEQTVSANQTWFEPADTPVRAAASHDHPKSGFVRFMVLPTEFLDKPSIRILDAQDAEKPRLQITHRHVDQVVRLPHG